MGRNKNKSATKPPARSDSEKRKPSSSPVDSMPPKSTRQDLVQKTLDFKTMAEQFCAIFTPGENVTSTPKQHKPDSEKSTTMDNVSGTPSYLDKSVFTFINSAAQDALTSKLSTALMLPQLQKKFQTAFMEVATSLITEHVLSIVKPMKESLEQLKGEIAPIKEDIRDLKKLRDELSPLKEEVESLKKDIGECSEEIEELREEVESKTEKIKKQKSDIRSLRRHLEERTDELEQYSQRNSIRITGVPESPHEQIDQVVMDVLTTIDEKLPISAIDRCHRVGQRGPGKTRQIIVKFMSHYNKYFTIKHRRHLANKYKNVYINEDLTKARSVMLKTARDMFKNKCFSGTWTRDGRIFVEEQPEGSERSRVIVTWTDTAAKFVTFDLGLRYWIIKDCEKYSK